MVIVKKCKASWFCGPFFLPVIVSFFELLNWTQILQHINQPVLTLIAQATTSTVQAGPSHSAQLKRRVDIKQRRLWSKMYCMLYILTGPFITQ